MFNRHKKRVKSVNLTDFYSEELKNNAEKVLKQRISSLKAESGKENSSELSESEIMKALEICTTKNASCSNCPAFTKVDESRCKEVLAGAIALINRKNAELERGTKDRYLYNTDGKIQLLPRTDLDEIRAEAVKEFAERVGSYWLQFVIDEIREFATKAGLDPVYSFNPTEKELNEKHKDVLEWLSKIAKEMGVEL